MARIQKVKQILTETLVPETAPFGSVFVCRDSQQVWIAVRSEEVLNLSDILDGKNVLASRPAKNGINGKDGISVKGERGERGADGKDGRPGKDGRDAVGIAGPQGRAGKDCQCKTADAEKRIAVLESNLSQNCAEFSKLVQTVADQKAALDALVSMNKQSGEYIEWLRERVALRAKQ
jgi:hypothetical protein